MLLGNLGAACARAPVNEILGHFTGPEAVFLTNGRITSTGLSEWTPFSGATFDSGLALVSTREAAVVWVEDED